MKRKIAGVMMVLAALVCCSTSAMAGVHIWGASARVKAVATYLDAQGAQTVAHPGAEVMGVFKNKPWPGVLIATAEEEGSGIFVPVSDTALAKGLCSDQKSLLRTFVPAAASPVEQYAAMIPPVKTVVSQDIARPIEDGDSCDERRFSGMVSKGALKASGGHTVDVLELHKRDGKDMRYKVKRLRVDAESRVAVPMVWSSDGSCVRMYSDEPLTEAELNTLLVGGESLEDINVSDHDRRSVGAHFTDGTFLIRP